MCTVYFHSVDYVLGRQSPRLCYQYRCHLPKALFAPGKKRSNKCQDFAQFQRMLTVKMIVYKQHRVMFRLYEKYCKEAELPKYWNDDDDGAENGDEIQNAEATNETLDDEGF